MKESKRRPWVGRTYKRGYSGSKVFDHSCRNHGGCDYCKSNRTYQDRKARENSKMSQTHYFIFIRKDLPAAQQIIQAAHAAYEAGKLDRSETTRSLVLSETNSEAELLDIANWLDYLEIEYIVFREPDIGNSATAIATVPLLPEQRRRLRSCKLWRA